MTSGQWVTGRTIYELSDLWDIPVSTIRDSSTEASRIVREAVATDDEVRSQLVATLQTITERSMTKGQLRTAVEAVRVLAGVSGAEKPKKLDVSGDLSGLLNLAFTGEDPGEGGGTPPD